MGPTLSLEEHLIAMILFYFKFILFIYFLYVNTHFPGSYLIMTVHVL